MVFDFVVGYDSFKVRDILGGLRLFVMSLVGVVFFIVFSLLVVEDMFIYVCGVSYVIG